jgi:sRNA-binding protein|tara:strand:- start:3 stop:347 length:345 start_codon:yes stop_codon:yes gene_type:complete
MNAVTETVLPTKNKASKAAASAKAAPKKSAQAAPKPVVPQPKAKKSIARHNFDGDTIRLLGDKIPVREGSQRAKIFELFKDGMPLTEFLSAARPLRGGAPDVQIALDKNYIDLI